jgi:DNA-binding beta-propeller fold protein YncE
VYLDVVEGANQGAHLGSTGDDMVIFRDYIYLLMSGSENLVVLNRADHRVVKSVYYPGSVPHAMVIDSVRGRIYVTRLYQSSVLALDLNTLGVMDSIAVGANPQEMMIVGDDLYVCNSGYGADNTISVLSLSPLQSRATLRVGSGPTGIVRAHDGTLWVACTGNAYGVPPSPGSLFAINPSTRSVQDSLVLTAQLWGSIALGNDGAAYVLGVSAGSFYGGPVHRFNLGTKALAQEVIPGTFYAMGIDGASGEVYVADAKSFTSQGEIRSYTTAFTLKRTVGVQRGPAVFGFAR